MTARIVVAPDKLKGTLSAVEAAAAIGRGVVKAGAIADLVPLADGGEGTLEVLEAAARAHGERVETRTTRVTGPLGEPVDAVWSYFPEEKRAVIEAARACGLVLVPVEKRDPLRATTRGVGQLALEAARAGAKTIWIALGGSASVDGGTGFARALGLRFLDEHFRELPEGGGALERVATVDTHGRVPIDAKIVAVADVRSGLLGVRGAARAFGPQKGATPDQVAQLERGLARLAYLVDPNASTEAGSGAAGGLGFAIVAFAHGEILPGAPLVAAAAGLDARLEGASLLVTAEGKLDATTFEGKAPQHALSRARTLGVPGAVVAGDVTPDARRRLLDVRVRRVLSLVELAGGDLELAKRDAAALLERAGEQLARECLA